MQTIRIQGSGFTRLISRQSGAGSILVTNTSLTVIVFLTDKDVGNPATADSVTLGPNASKTFDGSGDVYGFVTGGFADVEVIEGGVATFLGLTQSSGALVLPSIRSPNFVTTVSGWSINNDGTAEFNSVSIRGSTIIGSVSLWYDGPNPATANLIASVASSSGNDGHGHNYDQGIWVYDASGGGTTAGLVPALTGGGLASLFIGTGDAAELTASQFATRIAGAGALRQLQSVIRAPRVTSEAPVAACSVVMGSPSVDLTLDPFIDTITTSNDGTRGTTFAQTPDGFTFSGGKITATAGSAASPSTVTTDVFHAITAINGWASTTLKSMLKADRSVSVLGVIDSAAMTNTTFGQLPVGSRPATTQDVCVSFHTTVAANVGIFFRITGGTGSMAALNSAVGSGVLVAAFRVELDY